MGSEPRIGLEAARTAYDRHEWTAARDGLLAAEGVSALDGADSERLAWSCRWGDHPDEVVDWLERAEARFQAEGDRRGAARMALEQARHHKMMLSDAVAVTSYGRALEHLDGVPECPEHAHASWSLSFLHLEQGDDEAAAATLSDALDIARRLDHEGLQAMALQGQAHLAIANGRKDEGLALLDRATALAMKPSVAPVYAGYVYCATISMCRALCDWRRATEWTQVSTRYCERESIAGYTGLCRFHQAEIDRLHGRLDDAEERVERACAELLRVNRYSAAWGFDELVEIRVRKGDLEGADRALTQAMELGSDGQPGRAHLQLVRGQADAALRGLERTLTSRNILDRELRVFVLPVHVTAALRAGRRDRAESSTEGLRVLAERLGTPGPAAAVAVARGQLALDGGDLTAAAEHLADGVRAWCEVDAPYEAAQAKVLLARTLWEEGDGDTARLEAEAARQAFQSIGAEGEVMATSTLLDGWTTGPRRTAVRAFLFSDIVGSTRLAEAMGDDAWESLLSWHDRMLRATFDDHHGVEVKHAGDGFFVAFTEVDAALACATAIQDALAAHRASQGFAPGVRIGVHLGEATDRQGDYFGSEVNRAARIADTGAAGEVVVSREALDAASVAASVGERRTLELKGISGPVEVGVLVAGPKAG